MLKKKTIKTFQNYFKTLNEMELGAGCTAKDRKNTALSHGSSCRLSILVGCLKLQRQCE